MKKIVIIGAGVSGLVAALHLESNGYSPVIFEADTKVGGRVQSNLLDGYILDSGFQVLLSAYPMAKKYLDYDALNLKNFASGSYIFDNDTTHIIGDPLRDSSILFPTIFSGVGSFSDKWKVFKLSKALKKKSIATIFNEEETTTLQYLEDYGFSEKIINSFFKPFYTGIFLETNLETSSRMFEFIFKMFSGGQAAIPAKGIQEIPNQLASKLKKTTIEFEKSVQSVTGNKIVFNDESQQQFDYCIIATEASNLIPNLKNTEVVWKSTQTLYFEVSTEAVFNKKMIGLLANESKALINSICFPYTENSTNALLSVTIVKAHDFSEFELVKEVKKELNKYFKIDPSKYLKTIDITKALPNLLDVRYSVNPSETQLTESIFLAGDTMLNGSLNGAMHAGELAAQAVNEKVTGNILS